VKPFTAVLLAISLSACVNVSPLTISGTTIDIAGDQFVASAKLFNDGLDQGTVTVAQYREWANFGTRFQAAYPLAVRTWKTARETNDAVLEKKASELLSVLIRELDAYFVLVNNLWRASQRPDGGA